MSDKECIACYENPFIEWEVAKKQTENSSIFDHVDWCHEQRFGGNNFGSHPKYLTLTKIRYDVGLNAVCATLRKVLLVLHQHLDLFSDNNVMFEFFDSL